MDVFFKDYLHRLDELHRDFATSISALTTQELDWVPGQEMNSLCVLVIHTTGATRFWVGDVALGELSNRDRAVEFVANGYDEAGLLKRLDDTFAYVESALERVSLGDLATMRPVPGRDREYRLGWALLHALEHTGLHVGHAQITRQLLDQRSDRGNLIRSD